MNSTIKKTTGNQKTGRKEYLTWCPLQLKKLLLAVIIVAFLLLLSISFAVAQPSPHNVFGKVMTDSGNGVENGIQVFINNTANGDSVLTRVNAPPIPVFKGSYSDTINGSDNDLVTVKSWNDTHYGVNSSPLAETSTEINIVLNTSRDSEANVTIIAPANNSVLNTTDAFNVTATIQILGADGTDCNTSIAFSTDAANVSAGDNLTNPLGDISLLASEQTTWNVSGLKEGTLNVTVTAYCGNSGTNIENKESYTITLTIEDTTPPLVQLIAPLNNSYLNNPNITFTYNVTEGTGIADCSLYLNNQLNQTSYTLPSSTTLNFTLNETPDGAYDWQVICFDNSSNANSGSSAEWSFVLDVTPPIVTLLSPANHTITPNNTITYYYNISDSSPISNCTLLIDGQEKLVNVTISVNISNNFTYIASAGNQTWAVLCTDNASNIGQTFHYITILDPDLKVNSSDIVFSETTFVENLNITINATIYNLGNENVTNATISFFENDPDNGGVPIGSNVSVNISAGSNVTVSTYYMTRIGTVGIYVVADPPTAANGSIQESNETNNVANRTIAIPSFHIFYGNVISNIFLDTSLNYSVFSWSNSTNFTGNLFVADSDSTIDFNSLHALARNTSNSTTLDDFEELDEQLNISSLSDSINNSYRSNNQITSNDTFVIFGTSLEAVPIINSTNTSYFVTGILWDTSDVPAIGFYNGSQDVVFVTRINRNAPGSYGSYDYELRIPSRLRSYITPDLDSTISFYREIT